MNMNKVPLIVNTDWLSERLDDPRLRIIDATTYLKKDENGQSKVWSGIETYNEKHIPGAVFADLVNDFSDPNAKYPLTVPSHEQFADKMSELGVGDDNYVVIYDQGVLDDRN